MLALLTTMAPFATDTYLSAMPDMAEYFGVGIPLVEITLTIYFFAFALGNFFGGPLSDSFGRKKIALTGLFLYSISAAGIAAAPRIEYVWVLRATQAFGGGFATVTSMVFVRDWFEGKQVARMATIIGMIMMLAPLFAPVIGTFLLHLDGWQAIFIFLAVFGMAVFTSFYFVMPESRDKSLITKKISAKQFYEKYRLFFKNSQAVLVLIAIAFSISGMFTFITGSSFMYIKYFGIEPALFPVLFGSNVVLNVILSLANTILLKRYEPEQLLRLGLFMQLIAGIVLLITVQFTTPSFWVVFGSVVLFIGSLGLVFGNGTAIILNILPEISGPANATIGVTRFILSSIAASVPVVFYTGTLAPIGTVMFLCTAIGNITFYVFLKNKSKVSS